MSSNGPIGKPIPRIASSTVSTPAAALADDPERLEVVRPRDAVDDEARSVGDDDRGLAEPPGEVRDRIGHIGCGGRPGDHLHQRHERDRVEEVHADDSIWPARDRSDRGDRQRARVRGQDRAVGGRRVEPSEGVAFEREILGDGLDDQVRRGERFEAVGRPDAGEGIGRVTWVQLTLPDLAVEETADAVACPFGGAVQRVMDEDAEAGLRGHLDDAGAHRAGAEYADGVDLGHRPVNRGSRFSPKAATPSA